MEHDSDGFFNCFKSIGTCLLLSIAYISSLYIWKSNLGRDHPEVIKRRFLSVFVMMFVSPVFLYLALNEKTLEKSSLWEIMGLKTRGLCQAIVMPLFLTMVLFLGPICMQGFSGLLKLYTEPMYWITNVKDLIWLRNHVVAPLSEEFTFRSCMLPLLLQCFSPMTSVFVCPLFFGIAHFHHMIERVRSGLDLKTSFLISCFHFTYTTLFGAYSAYLFVRTGHFAATVVVHAFCNHMGVPNLQELSAFKDHQKTIVILLFFVGFALWCLLLQPLTEPRWFHNEDPVEVFLRT